MSALFKRLHWLIFGGRIDEMFHETEQPTTSRVFTRYASDPIPDDEREMWAGFDRAFDKMGGAFDEMAKAFDAAPRRKP